MISKDEVKHIAKLARLELTEAEVEKMQKDLSSILDYFNVLKKAPRNNAEIDAEKRGIKENALREDKAVPKSSGLASKLIEMAPDKKEGYIKVKAVL